MNTSASKLPLLPNCFESIRRRSYIDLQLDFPHYRDSMRYRHFERHYYAKSNIIQKFLTALCKGLKLPLLPKLL
jgi:hypothetical protein